MWRYCKFNLYDCTFSYHITFHITFSSKTIATKVIFRCRSYCSLLIMIYCVLSGIPSKPHSIMNKRQARKRPLDSQPSVPTSRDLEASVTFARDTITRMTRLEMNLGGADVRVKQGTPAHGQLIDAYPSTEALLKGKDAWVAVKASLYLAHNHCRR